MCLSKEMIPHGTLRTQRSLQQFPPHTATGKTKQGYSRPGSPGRVQADLLWSSRVTVTE